MKYTKKLQKQNQEKRLWKQCYDGTISLTKLFNNFLLLLLLLAAINFVENAENFNVGYQKHQLLEVKETPEYQIEVDLRNRHKRGVFRDAFQKAVIVKNLIADQHRDARESFDKIYDLINGQFSDPAPMKSIKLDAVELMGNNDTTLRIVNQPTTTTEYQLTRYELGRIFGRNFRGLQRLTDIEWRDALHHTKHNLKEYKQEALRQFTKNNIKVNIM